MERMSEEEIIPRARSAWRLRDLWMSILREAYEMAAPWRNPYTGDDENPKPMNNLYDSTALNSTMKLANKLLLELTPPDQQWADIKIGPLLEIQIGDNKEVIQRMNKELAKIQKVIFMSLNTPSFTSAAHEAYLDLIVAGMGVILMNENPTNDLEPFTWECIPQNEIAIDEGPGRALEGVFRRRKVKCRMIERLWSDAKLTEDLQKMKSAKGDPQIDVMECIHYVPGAKKPWAYDVFWMKGEKSIRLVQRDYTDRPLVVFRWMVLPGLPYGPGPVLMALPDIRTANKTMEMILKNAALALAGMYMVRDDGVINIDNVRITQGGMIPVASTGGSAGASIAPLPTGRSFDVGQLILDDIRLQIKKTLLDMGLPEISGKSFSPTEIMQRTKELTQDYGGAIGRINNELVVPIVRLAANKHMASGKIPSIKLDQYLTKIQVNSPMARAQQFQDLERTVKWLETNLALGGREITFLRAKIEEFASWSAYQLGVPLQLIRTDEEAQDLQQSIAQIIAQQSMQATGNSVQQAV